MFDYLQFSKKPTGHSRLQTTYNKNLSLLKQPLLSVVNEHLIAYPTPSNLNYFWGFGSLAGICLIIQIATGVFLAMHYCPEVNLAFSSVEHIMRDVQGGYILRYAHANGASLFFMVVMIHILRSLYYGSYYAPREAVWIIGVVILFLMIATAFIGYALPFGQQSLWGISVITSLFSVVPFVGNELVQWLWGGFSVNNATLNRFFSLHYLLPFLIAGASIVHIAALHHKGSNNPLGINAAADKISFYPYLVAKDLVGLMVLLIILSGLVFFAPNYLSHPDNYIPANSLVTPLSIMPEWYFLIVYCILRSIPNKTGGVLAIALVFVALLAVPFLAGSPIRSSSFRPLHRKAFYAFLSSCLILSWAGSKPVEQPYIFIGQCATVFFFVYFFVLVPLLSRLEYLLLTRKVNVK
uniref:apocytochrome b n=1 Tax=Gayralia brasiliensis TaxID=1286870 RepID=UPI002411037A|nr:apocytochrome b [Gayralia brasiliensis]YP_010733841.1 apocytochrome b [Monostroma nitidum]WEG93083.1 apocytochrome b [Gayralia brasiliensis]WEG93112.1 apocytochrome b [Monostroma nitidum]